MSVSKDDTGGFGFGGTTTEKTEESNPSTTIEKKEVNVPKTSGFGFGGKTTEKKETEESKPSTTIEKKEVNVPKTSGFGFGGKTTEKTEESKPSTTIEKKEVNVPKTSGFGFGGKTTEKKETKLSTTIEKKEANVPKTSGFGFGGTTTEKKETKESKPSVFRFGFPIEKKEANVPGFGFGGTTTEKKETEVPKTSGFGFGGTTKEKKEAEVPKTSGFGFGGSAPSTKTPFGSETSTPQVSDVGNSLSGFGFGNTSGDNKNQPFKKTDVSTPFGQVATPNSGGFGQVSTPNSSGFGQFSGFGTKSNSSLAPTNVSLSNPATSTFGQSVRFGGTTTEKKEANVPKTSGFGFGGTTTEKKEAEVPKPSGFGFGSSSTTTKTSFGSNPASFSQFSQINGSTNGGFGANNAVGGFGGASGTVTGTSNPRYQATYDRTAQGNFQSITAMTSYKSKSFEELRLEDYSIGRKPGQSGQNTGGGLLSSPGTSFSFLGGNTGTTGGFGANQTTGFGSSGFGTTTPSTGLGTTGGFGQQQQKPGGFGTSTTGGFGTGTTGGFGTGTTGGFGASTTGGFGIGTTGNSKSIRKRKKKDKKSNQNYISSSIFDIQSVLKKLKILRKEKFINIENELKIIDIIETFNFFISIKSELLQIIEFNNNNEQLNNKYTLIQNDLRSGKTLINEEIKIKRINIVNELISVYRIILKRFEEQRKNIKIIIEYRTLISDIIANIYKFYNSYNYLDIELDDNFDIRACLNVITQWKDDPKEFDKYINNTDKNLKELSSYLCVDKCDDIKFKDLSEKCENSIREEYLFIDTFKLDNIKVPFKEIISGLKYCELYFKDYIEILNRKSDMERIISDLSEFDPTSYPPSTDNLKEWKESRDDIIEEIDLKKLELKIAERKKSGQETELRKKIDKLKETLRKEKYDAKISKEEARLYSIADKLYPELMHNEEWMSSIDFNQNDIENELKQLGLFYSEDNVENSYLIEKDLDSFSKVQLVKDTQSNRKFVWKKFHLGDENNRRRLYRQLTILSKLQHPCIIPVRRVVKRKDIIYLILPYFGNGDFSNWMNNNNNVKDYSLAKVIIKDIFKGLNHLHSQGLVHGDIKPSNILLKDNFNGGVIGDFDGVKDLNSTITMVNQNTFQYLAPEILNGEKQEIDSFCDIYSIGKIIEEYFKDYQEYKENSLLINLINSDSNKRASALQVLNDPFFKDVKDGIALYDCNICLDMCPNGIRCEYGHFSCEACFGQNVLEYCFSNNFGKFQKLNGNIKCVDPNCSFYFSRDKILKHLDSAEIANSYLNNIKKHGEKEGISSQESVLNSLKQELLDIKDKGLREHINHITENILTLRCSRCSSAFYDFNGCTALSCNNCSSGFCGWCLRDCGRDAHQHIGRCELRPRNKDPLFPGIPNWISFHNDIKRKETIKYLKTLKNEEFITGVLKFLNESKSVKELNIKRNDLN